MKLIHLFYQQKPENFVNDGQLLLWVESSQITKGKDVYPYQLKKEELIDGIEFGGVGYYLGSAEDSSVNLFI